MVLKNFMRLWKEDSLLVQASSESGVMLKNSKHMFNKAMKVLLEGKQKFEIKPEDKRINEFEIKSEDKRINESEMNIRKKVLAHLVVSSKVDVTASLILIGLVKDVERIGDLSKDIVKLTSMYNKTVSESKYLVSFKDLANKTVKMFELTEDSLKSSNVKKAKVVMKDYLVIADKCDKIAIELSSAKRCSNSEIVTFVLLSRYVKRVNGHLMNIASTIANPFHKVSFKTI